MRERAKWFLSAGTLAAGIGLIAVACSGGNKRSADEPVKAATTRPAAESSHFANFKVAYDAATDFLDPGLAQSGEAGQIMWNVYLPLLGYKHVSGPDGATIVPYLARDMPKISADGKTYTLTLRKGLVYSNGKRVKASDFRYAVERDFQIDSPGVAFFTNIVGAARYGETRKGSIEGIVANDRTGQITIRLEQPQADFVNVLATEFAAPIPADTPLKDQSTNPIPSTGPYTIHSYNPTKSIVVVRNPHWRRNSAAGINEVPTGNPDRMTFTIYRSDAVALQSTIDGKNDYDFSQPPANRLAEVKSKFSRQLRTYVPGNTYYFFMNRRVAPFKHLAARRAVEYGIDRNAIVQLYGGLAVATENLLPPTYPQFTRLRLYPYNLAKARALVRRCGCARVPITVWTNTLGANPKASGYLVTQLTNMGFERVRLKIVSSAVYWTTIGNQATKAQIGLADWLQDYPHPLDWFDVLVNGRRIAKTNNGNYGNVDDPRINGLIEELKRAPKLTPRVNRQWARVDRLLDQDAGVAAFLNRRYIHFFSSAMDLSGGCYVNHVLYSLDYAQVCKAAPGG